MIKKIIKNLIKWNLKTIRENVVIKMIRLTYERPSDYLVEIELFGFLIFRDVIKTRILSVDKDLIKKPDDLNKNFLDISREMVLSEINQNYEHLDSKRNARKSKNSVPILEQKNR